MKITICGSIAFHSEMLGLERELELMGHEVEAPATEIRKKEGVFIPAKDFYQLKKAAGKTEGWMWDRVQENILSHFDKIAWSDAILVANYTKNEVANYVGGNTLMECGVALYLKKKIFLLQPIPDLGYSEELLAMQPVVINGDLSVIK
jgi:hypothetical protein